MTSDQVFLLIPAGILILISFFLIKKGISIRRYDLKTKAKGEIFIPAIISNWADTGVKNRVRGLGFTPILTYEINGIEYANKRCCSVQYPPLFMLKYPVGSNVTIIGRPSNFGLYGSEFGGYTFEIYDQNHLSRNKNGLSTLCYITAVFLGLAGISMLFGL